VSAHTLPLAATAAPAARRPRVGAGGFTWVTAAGLSAALLAAAVAGRDSTILLVAGATIVGATVFALRPALGIALFLLVRPSLDLWADRTVAHVGSHGVNAAAITGVLLIALAGSYIAERWREARAAPSFMPFALFALVAGLSIGVAPSKSFGATEWLRLMTMVVLYGAAYAAARAERRPGRFAAVVLASAVVPVAVGVYQTAHGTGRLIASFGRATGTFLHPDPYGLFLAIVICFLAPFAVSKTFRWRVAVWVAVPLVIVALVGSYTRTAWIGAIFGLLVLGAVRYRPLLFLVPVVAVGLSVAVPSTSQRFADVSRGPISDTRPGNSFRARVDLWKQNLPKVKRNPVIGQGFGAITKDEGVHVHSDYVRSIVETGVLGFGLYVWLLVSAVLGAIRARRRAVAAGDEMGVLVSLGALAASGLFMIMSGDSNLMTQVAVAAPLWGFMAAAHAVATDTPEPRKVG